MSTLHSSAAQTVYNIRTFRGVNESADGDTRKAGEAASMSNYRVTDGGMLEPRAGLYCLRAHDSEAAGYINGGSSIVYLFENMPSIPVYRNVRNVQTADGVRIEVDKSSDPIGSISYASAEGFTWGSDNNKAYFEFCGDVYQYWGNVAPAASGAWIDARAVFARKLALVSDGVTQLWSGIVAGKERMLMLHARRLFDATDPTDIKVISSVGYTDSAFIFGFADKAYILSDDNAIIGGSYFEWDGVTMRNVEGYIPCVLTACNAEGVGTLYERVNNLTTQRKVRYSANGTSTTFKLPQTARSIQYVKYDGQEVQDYTANPASETEGIGSITLTLTENAPIPAGTNNLEICYTAIDDLVGEYDHAEYGGDGTQRFFAIGAEKTYGYSQVTVSIDGVYQDSKTAYTIAGNSVVFKNAPAALALIKIWAVPKTAREAILGMRGVEIYNGAQDNRVFLYGDGSNRAVYSGIDENGKPTAAYFPDLNEMLVGEDNTPITSMIRHYNRLLAFKKDSTYSISYGLMSLADGSETSAFYLTAINKGIGNEPLNQACAVNNRIRTLDGADIYEWRATNTSGNITQDQRNAERISEKVSETLKSFVLSKAMQYYDKYEHEYYCAYGDKAIVQNLENEAWYVYDGFPAQCMARHKGKLYVGTRAGDLCAMDKAHGDKLGGWTAEKPVDVKWESGELSFDRDFQMKYSPSLWLRLKPESGVSLNVGAETDTGDKAESRITVLNKPKSTPHLVNAKVRKFAYYVLKLTNVSGQRAASVISANIRVRYNNTVKRG